jgi:hypothetical protein
MNKLEEDDIPGFFLLLIDFEKAFDTVEWSVIEKNFAILWFWSISSKMVKTLLL